MASIVENITGVDSSSGGSMFQSFLNSPIGKINFNFILCKKRKFQIIYFSFIRKSENFC